MKRNKKQKTKRLGRVKGLIINARFGGRMRGCVKFIVAGPREQREIGETLLNVGRDVPLILDCHSWQNVEVLEDSAQLKR